jgi:hypothetical protein
MSRLLFMTILERVRGYNSYITCRTDATGKLGFTSYKNYSQAIRMLAYGIVGDFVDEYLQ